MGTSVEQIDRTYGHLLPDSIDRTRVALNSSLAAPSHKRKETGGRVAAIRITTASG